MSAELVRADNLSDLEALDLLEAERTIERGLKTFVEVGTALARIRDGRLYRLDYDTFETYCDQRWGFTRIRAHQLIEAAGVVLTTVNTGYRPPANERQARELARAPEAERGEVWREANDRANGRPTAATIREVVRERHPTPPDKDPNHGQHAAPGTAAQDSDPHLPDPLPDAVRVPAGSDLAEPAGLHRTDALTEPSPVEAVAAAIEQYLPADPDTRFRAWRKGFMADLIAAHRALSRNTAEQVAELADNECIAELARLAESARDFVERVRQLRAESTPDNVVPIGRQR